MGIAGKKKQKQLIAERADTFNTSIDVTADYSILLSDEVIMCTGEITLTLPEVSTADFGKSFLIVNEGSGIVTLDGNGSEEIEGKTSVTLLPNTSRKVNNVGSFWAVTRTDTITASFNTPVNGTATYTEFVFSGVSSDGEIVTFGTEVYEFKTSGSATEGNILVDVSGAVTATASAVALAAAIDANTEYDVTIDDGTADTVKITASDTFEDYNDLPTTTDCANGDFPDTTFGGGTGNSITGVDASVGTKGEMRVDATKIYVATTDVSKNSVSGWKSASLS